MILLGYFPRRNDIGRPRYTRKLKPFGMYAMIKSTLEALETVARAKLVNVANSTVHETKEC